MSGKPRASIGGRRLADRVDQDLDARWFQADPGPGLVVAQAGRQLVREVRERARGRAGSRELPGGADEVALQRRPIAAIAIRVGLGVVRDQRRPDVVQQQPALCVVVGRGPARPNRAPPIQQGRDRRLVREQREDRLEPQAAVARSGAASAPRSPSAGSARSARSAVDPAPRRTLDDPGRGARMPARPRPARSERGDRPLAAPLREQLVQPRRAGPGATVRIRPVDGTPRPARRAAARPAPAARSRRGPPTQPSPSSSCADA